MRKASSRPWQKEIRILGEDFLINKSIVETIIKNVEMCPAKDKYSKAQKMLFKYM